MTATTTFTCDLCKCEMIGKPNYSLFIRPVSGLIYRYDLCKECMKLVMSPFHLINKVDTPYSLTIKEGHHEFDN